MNHRSFNLADFDSLKWIFIQCLRFKKSEHAANNPEKVLGLEKFYITLSYFSLLSNPDFLTHLLGV